MANKVTITSKVAAIWTPEDIEQHENQISQHGCPSAEIDGNCTLRYAPMASAMAGGAKTNSINVAAPAR